MIRVPTRAINSPVVVVRADRCRARVPAGRGDSGETGCHPLRAADDAPRGRTAGGSANRASGGELAPRTNGGAPNAARPPGALETARRRHAAFGAGPHCPPDCVALRAGHGNAAHLTAARAFGRAAIHVEVAAAGGQLARAHPCSAAEIVQSFIGRQAEEATELTAAGRGEAVTGQALHSSAASPATRQSATDILSESAAASGALAQRASIGPASSQSTASSATESSAIESAEIAAGPTETSGADASAESPAAKAPAGASKPAAAAESAPASAKAAAEATSGTFVWSEREDECQA